MDVNDANLGDGRLSSVPGPSTTDAVRPSDLASAVMPDNDDVLGLPTAGYYDAPTEYQGLPSPNLQSDFGNPYAPIPELNVGGAKPFDLDSAMNALSNKRPSFQAATAPVFFDWDLNQTDRYVNSDYYQEKGFLPGRDNETLYGERQTFGDTMEQAFKGMASLSWNSFKEGWKGWGNLVDALFHWGGDHSFMERLMGTPEELAEMNREQTDIFNKYAIFRTPESESSIFNRQFLGNLIQQGGFALGTMGQFAMEELLTMGMSSVLKPLTGLRSISALIKAGVTGERMAADAVKLGTAWKDMNAMGKMYHLLKQAGTGARKALTEGNDLFSLVNDISKARKGGATGWEVGALTFNAFRRTMAETNMSFTESRMEAAGTYADLRQQLYDKTLADKGDVSFEDQQRIESMSQKAAWQNFKVNALVISAMNRIQYDNIISSFGSSKRMLKHLAEEGDDILKVSGKAAKDLNINSPAYGEILVKQGERTTKLYEKNIFRNYREIAEDFGKRTAAWEATKFVGRHMMKWELTEGLQELIQEGSNQAIKDYYADLYNVGKASWGKSIDKGVESQMNKQGLETFLMGAMTGRLLSPITSGVQQIGERLFTSQDQRNAAKTSRVEAMNVLNAFFADPSRFAPEQVANLKIQNRAAEKMQEALSERDKYMYENAKDAAFAKAIFSAKKLGMMDALEESFRDYGKHFDNSQFFEAFGVDMTDENRPTVSKVMNDIADKAVRVSKRFDELKEKYGDLIQPERFVKEDRERASIAARALDDTIEWMATNEFKANQASERIVKIMESASKIPSVGKSAYTTIHVLGNDELLDGEITLLTKELAEDEERLSNSTKKKTKENANKPASKQVQQAVESATLDPQNIQAAPPANAPQQTGAAASGQAAIEATQQAPQIENQQTVPSTVAPAPVTAAAESRNRQNAAATSEKTKEAQDEKATEEEDVEAGTDTEEPEPLDPAILRRIEQKEKELAALLDFRKYKNSVMRQRSDKDAEPISEEDEQQAKSAVANYLIAKNQEAGITTDLTGTDLQDFLVSLRDIRALDADRGRSMNAYAFMANSRGFMGGFIRASEGLEYVQMLQRAIEKAEKERNAAANANETTSDDDAVDAGKAIGSYHGFKLGDKVLVTINKVQGKYTIERLSTTGVELLNNISDKRTKLSLDRFDELVANSEIELENRVEHLDQAMPGDKKLIDKKEGVFLVHLFKEKLFVLTDNAGNVYANNGKDEFTDETEARDARDRVIASLKKQQAADRAPYPFDGREIRYNDVLIDQDGKRYHVATKPGASQEDLALTEFTGKDLQEDRDGNKFLSEGSATVAKGTPVTSPEYVASFLNEGDQVSFFAERWRTGTVTKDKSIRDDAGNPWGITGILTGENGKIINLTQQEKANNAPKTEIELAPIEGGQNIKIKSLQGYELATEAAVKRKEKEATRKRFKLTNINTPGLIRAIPKEGQSPEVANKELEDFILGITRDKLMENLSIHISRQETQADTARKGKEDENKNLQESTGPLLVELLYDGKVIGVFNFYDRYQYKDANGDVVDVEKLTVDQFKEIFDTGDQDARKLLDAFRVQSRESELVFNQLMEQVQSGKKEIHNKKEVAVVKGPLIPQLLYVRLLTGTYDYVHEAKTALKDLKYNSVNGKTVVAVRNASGTMEVRIDSATKAEEEAINKLIQKNKKQLDNTPGNYIAIVALPNEELRFVPLLAPAYETKELDTLAQAIAAQSEKTKKENLDAKGKGKKQIKDSSFNASFNKTVLGSLVLSAKLEKADYAVSMQLNASGGLVLQFQNKSAGTSASIEINGPKGNVLPFTDFAGMLKAINEKIEAYDSDPKTPAAKKLMLRLRAENFRKQVDDVDFSQVRDMPAFVGKNVVKEPSIALKPKSDMNAVVSQPMPTFGVPAESVAPAAKSTTPAATTPVTPATGTANAAATTTTVTPATGTGQQQKTTPNVVPSITTTVTSKTVTGQEQTTTPPPVITAEDAFEAKQNTLREMEQQLVDLKTTVFNDHLATTKDTTKALEQTNKDSRVQELDRQIEELKNELDAESTAYKVIGTDEWENKWSKAAVEKVKTFTDWVRDSLPSIITVEQVELIRQNMLKQGVTVGKFVYSLRSLSEEKKGRIVVDPAAPFKYHEAFHAVFRLVLTEDQIKEHLDIARREVREQLKKEGKSLKQAVKEMVDLAPKFYEGLSEKELEDQYLEEHLADRFDAWMMKPGVKTDPRNKTFFRWLLDMIRGIFGYTTPAELETLFYDINARKFKGNSLAVNRFTTAERLQIGKEVEVPKNLPEEITTDANGKTIVRKFMAEEKSTSITAAIAALLYNRRENAGEKRSQDELLDEIIADYAKLYDKNNQQYIRYLDHPDTRDKYFKTARELDQLQKVFVNPESKQAIKEAVMIHQRSIDYLIDKEAEDEEAVWSEMGDRAGMDFLKNKESYGGFGSLPKWLRQYISTTTYAAEDQYGNTQLKDGEPLLQAVDATRVYSGILKVVAGFDDLHKMLLRMQEFGRYNKESGYFVRRFFADMGVEVTKDGYTIAKEEMAHKFMMVMKRFQQYTPDYLLFSRDMANRDTRIIKSNQRDATSNQLSRWYNAYSTRFESPYLQSENKTGFLEKRLTALELFHLKANPNKITDEELREVSEKISMDLADQLGLSLHPTFIQYSLACARTVDNLTPAQIELVKTFSEVASMKASDAAGLMETIRSGQNPFAAGQDIQKAQEIAMAQRAADEEGQELDPEDFFDSVERLRQLGYSNSIFDETVNTTSFKNAKGDLIYAHQLPTYHLAKVRTLAQLLAQGSEPNEELNALLNDPYLARHFLLEQDNFRQMAGDMKISRIEGISAKYGNTRKGVTYGSFTEREMLVALFELYGANKKYEGADGRTFMTTQHLIRVIEASNTGDTVNLPAFNAVNTDIFDGLGLSKQTLNMMLGEVRREFERIGRVKKEIAKIEEERIAYETNGTPRTTQEIDEYHNTRGAKNKDAKPKGLTLFKTKNLLGSLAEAIEKEAHADNPNFEQFEGRIKDAIRDSLIGSRADLKELLKNPKKAAPKSLLHKMLKEMLKNDIITVDKKGELQNVLLPRVFAEGYKTFDGEIDEEKNEALNLQPNDLIHNISQIVINDYVNTIAVNQLLLGDQARSLADYVDMVKRAKGANGSGSSIYADIIAPKLGIKHTNMYSHILHIDDPMYEGLYAGDRVRKADGQMWMTLKSLRYTLFGLGKLTPKIAGLLDKLERGEKVEINEIFGADGSIAYNGQTNSMKMVYYDQSRYIKISAFVVTPELTSVKNRQGDWVARDGYEELHQLRTKMEKFEEDHQTITMAVPKSSSKNEKANVARGILPVQRKVGDEIITEDPISDWNFQQLDNRYWRLQIENSSNKLMITDPTQAKQIIMHEQNNDLKVQFAWSTSGDPGTKELTVGQLKQMFLEQSAQRVKLKYWHARGEIFDLQGSLDEVAKSIKEGKVTPKLEAFQKRALENLRNSGADSQVLDFFTLGEDGKPKYNLNHPVTLDKFTQLFLAHFSKDVMNEKIPGHAIALVSSFGTRVMKEVLAVDENGQPKWWRVVRRREYEQAPELYKGALRWEDDEKRTFSNLQDTFKANQDAGRPTYILDDLRHDVPEYKIINRKWGKDASGNDIIVHPGEIAKDDNGNDIILDHYTEYMMAPHSAEAMELADGHGEIPDVLARSFGVRIPSQDKHSTVALRLVDFLPAHYGSSGMFAPELTQISGADYDIDMLYTSIKEYYTKRKNGKLEFIEYGRATGEEDQYKEFLHYQRRKNKDFQRRYRELLVQDPAYQSWVTEARELKKLVGDYEDKATKRGASPSARLAAFETRRSVDALFDVIFGTDSTEQASQDFDQLMDNIEKDEYLHDLRDAMHSRIFTLMRRIQAPNHLITMQVLKEFNMPLTAKEYAARIKSAGEQNIGKLNNQILDTKMTMLSNEHMRSKTDKNGKTITPIAYEVASIEPLERVIKYLKETFPNLVDQLEEGSEDVDSILGKVIAYRNNKEGAANIGPAVNAMLAYALLNEFNVQIRTEKNDWEGKPTPLWHFRLNGVPFTSYGNTRALSGKDADGNGIFEGESRIMNDLSAIVTAMTDNAKERLAAKLGLNIEAVGIVSNMVAQGVPLLSAITFILQPIVQEYYANTRNLRSGLRTEEEENETVYAVGQQMLADLENELGEKANEKVDLTDEMLKENILNEGTNKQHELAVLRSFMNMKEQTEYFAKVAGVMKLSKGLGTSMEDLDAMDSKIADLKLYADDEQFEKSKAPFDLRQVMTGRNPDDRYHNGMAEYLKIFNEFKLLSQTVFIERTEAYQRMASVIKGNMRIPNVEKERVNKDLKRTTISALALKLYFKKMESLGRVQRLASLHNAMIYDAEAVQMPEAFEDIIATILTIRERLPNNYFVRHFLDAMPTSIHDGVGMQDNPYNTTGINKAEVNTWARLNQLQTEKLQDSFHEIYMNLNGQNGKKGTRNQAWALFHYLLVKDGGQFKNGSFIRYVPTSMFKDLLDSTAEVNEALLAGLDSEKFKSVFGVDGKTLMHEFVRGYLMNVNNRNYIREIDLSSDSSVTPDTFNLSQDGEVLSIDLRGGVKKKIPYQGPRKISDVKKDARNKRLKWTDEEMARAKANWDDLKGRGFWQTSITVEKNSGPAEKTDVLRFPLLIQTKVKVNGVEKQVYYRLAEVDGKKLDESKPLMGLNEDQVAMGGEKAKYQLLEGLEGSPYQWSGAFILGKANTKRILRERPLIENNGAYHLDADPVIVKALGARGNGVVTTEDAAQAFKDAHGIDVGFDPAKGGLFFEQNGQPVADQKATKEKYVAFAQRLSTEAARRRAEAETVDRLYSTGLWTDDIDDVPEDHGELTSDEVDDAFAGVASHTDEDEDLGQQQADMEALFKQIYDGPARGCGK